MEEARFLLSENFMYDVVLPKMEHLEIKGLFLERTQKWVGGELGLNDTPLKEVRVEVTWGSRDNPESYVLTERFYRTPE